MEALFNKLTEPEKDYVKSRTEGKSDAELAILEEDQPLENAYIGYDEERLRQLLIDRVPLGPAMFLVWTLVKEAKARVAAKTLEVARALEIAEEERVRSFFFCGLYSARQSYWDSSSAARLRWVLERNNTCGYYC
jgi:hypothetical protein